MRRVAVIGVGVTRFGKHDRRRPSCSPRRPGRVGRRRARPSAIQALYYGKRGSGARPRAAPHRAPGRVVLGIPTVPTTRFETACACRTPPSVTPRWRSPPASPTHHGGRRRARAERPTATRPEYFAYASDARWEQTLASRSPASSRSSPAPHGEVRDDRGADGSRRGENHRHGALNPKAQFRKEITLDTVMTSPYIADPLKPLRLLSLHDAAPP